MQIATGGMTSRPQGPDIQATHDDAEADGRKTEALAANGPAKASVLVNIRPTLGRRHRSTCKCDAKGNSGVEHQQQELPEAWERMEVRREKEEKPRR